ncbi:anti-sigma factor family protein [Kineothrix sp. MB12-C1]|uniref:anti-sigma factor family protein n=1 Tax=Kineothrix sp. MB12-C1 TaxID=3070215 RepID=UPI0027D300B6|nr:zf-HC2 domain-containing protein [Kineothrix sp. MB12-C1]WMC92627.1 zf-HC2 domain-containing protein [Kineothrix sp. MB12-C1]
MNCKKVDKMIPMFLNKELSGRELSDFMEHISVCPECKEELNIQFLVMEGMASLEGGDAFDLNKNLNKQLEDARRKVQMRKGFHLFVYGLEVLAIITMITIIVLVMVL